MNIAETLVEMDGWTDTARALADMDGWTDTNRALVEDRTDGQYGQSSR